MLYPVTNALRFLFEFAWFTFRLQTDYAIIGYENGLVIYMEITIVNQSGEKNWNRYRHDFEMIVERAVQFVNIDPEACLSVIFVNEEQIHEMNRDYRNIDRPTDVISFALHDTQDDYECGEEEEQLGDIFINVAAIRSQAADYGHSLRREVCFLFTHGLLHLLGYDHMHKDEEKIMFQLQDEILDALVKR